MVQVHLGPPLLVVIGPITCRVRDFYPNRPEM